MNQNNHTATYQWVSTSALFHIIPNCVFLKDKLAFKVDNLISDSKFVATLENPDRVKKTIFNYIQDNYNRRILKKRSGNTLQLSLLSNKDISNLNLKNMKVSKSEPGKLDLSGRFKIYPRTFVCSKCDTFHYFDYKKPIIMKCNCGGELEQVSVVKFCKNCGKIDELYASCQKCKEKGLEQGAMKLRRGSKDALTTWSFECQHKHKEDIMSAFCNHKDYRNKVNPDLLSEGASLTKFQVLTIRENSVFIPIVITTVDIRDTNNIKDIEQLELILFGMNMNLFDQLLVDTKSKNVTLLQFINNCYKRYYSDELKQMFIEGRRLDNKEISEEEINEQYKIVCKMDVILKIIDSLERMFPPENYDQESFNNYNALKGIFSEVQYSKTFSNLISGDSFKEAEWIEFKKTFKINEITYLEKMRVISATVGLVRGINKADEDFVPHFEPIWNDPTMITRDKFSAFINPYDTEGLLIDFDKKMVFDWLKENAFLSPAQLNKTPEEFMLSIDKESKEYQMVMTLLHTLAHILIKKSAIHTGIDANSCSEMVFPNNGAILIYSTSNINIGGFGHVFENYLFDLFKESDFELRQCIYDPACNSTDGSSGACFSCLHLPEHVCRYHNQFLDRDILKSEWRYKTNFWK
ncbi:MAG: hypothetical protein KJ597_06050 [Nanoarchaeota archaeon]|nr:hypothetical protein [Nanoarchaeota archaeon]